jgi:23S rRNA (uracil1939-C5)-methyltransferase
VKSPLQSGYRTSSKLALHQDNFARRTIGIYERGTKDVVDIAECPVHAPEINQLVAKIFRSSGMLPFDFYNHSKKSFQENCLKFVTIRVGSATKEAGVIISHTGVNEAELKEWVEKKFPKTLSVWGCLLGKDDRDLILNNNLTHLAGPELLDFKIGSFHFDLHPAAFFQANSSLTDEFITYICGDLSGAGLLDLYGGFGAYSLAVSRNFDQIWLVDGNKDAIHSAKKSAAENNITNIMMKAQFCEAFLKGMSDSDRKKITHIIVNPPRTGLTDTVRRALNRTKFPALKSVTYISCDPQTLKRDLGEIIKTAGAKLESVQPFDMFPQTNHIENVARIKY